jgi:hypothetical protein
VHRVHQVRVWVHRPSIRKRSQSSSYQGRAALNCAEPLLSFSRPRQSKKLAAANKEVTDAAVARVKLIANAVQLGLGRIVALHRRPSASYKIR